jgi:hypothetical protein
VSAQEFDWIKRVVSAAVENLPRVVTKHLGSEVGREERGRINRVFRVRPHPYRSQESKDGQARLIQPLRPTEALRDYRSLDRELEEGLWAGQPSARIALDIGILS